MESQQNDDKNTNINKTILINIQQNGNVRKYISVKKLDILVKDTISTVCINTECEDSISSQMVS